MAMTPNEIRAELIRRGIRVKDIAAEAGVAPEAVSQAINPYGRYKGYRIRPIIAAKIDRTVEEIWGDGAA